MNYHRANEGEGRSDGDLLRNLSRSADTPQDRSGTIWNPPDVLRLLTALEHHWKWIAVAPVLGVLATVGYLLFTGPSYDVGAQLMVRFGYELAAPPTVSTTQASQQVIPISKRLEDITAEVQIMKDPRIVREVVEGLGEDFFYGEDEPVTFLQKVKRLFKDSISYTKETVRGLLVKIGILPELSKLDRIVAALQTYLTIEHVSRSDVVEVHLLYPDPRLGEEVLSRFVDTYLERREKVYGDDRVSTFFARELGQLNRSLLEAESSYSLERQKLAAWSIDDQRSLAVQRRETLRSALQEATATVQVANARIVEIDKQLAELPREGLLKERGDTRLLVAATQSKVEALTRDIAGVENELKAMEEAGLTLSRKLRDVERLRLAQQHYQQGSDEARISAEIAKAQISNVVVIAEPQAGVTPAAPRVPRLLLLALVLSVLGACGLVLLFDALRPKVRSNGDIVGLVDGRAIVRALGEHGRGR